MVINGQNVHATVTLKVVVAAVERRRRTLDDPGFCICCGLECLGVEPDARQHECEGCGEPGVYGAEELLMEMS